MCFLFSLYIGAQECDLSVTYRFGFALQDLKVLNPSLITRYDHTKVQSVYDQGINLSYATPLWKKQLVFVNGGFDFSRSKHVQSIIEPDRRTHLDNIILEKDRIALHLGLHKRFSLMSGNVEVDLGSDLVYRFFLNKDFSQAKLYSTDFISNNEDWIEYKYNLTTFHGSYFENDARINHSGSVGLDINAFLKLKMGTQSYINLGFNLTTHNIFFYDYTYSINRYSDGIISDSYTYLELPESKFGIRTTNLYFNLGYTFLLKKKESN